jgi:CheY-like chemotaxis protein
MTQSEGKILVAVDDMFFAAKIIGAAEQAGKPIERLKSAEAIYQAVQAGGIQLLVIDLNAAKFDAVQVIEWLKGQSLYQPIPIIGFLSHVQVDLKHRAEAAGCDRVLPRSAFSQRLTEILSGNFPPSTS